MELKLKKGTLEHIPYPSDNNDKEISYRSASGSEDELAVSNSKKIGNPQASDQNSMLGTTDN